MGVTLTDFLARLDTYDRQIPLPDLMDSLATVDLSAEDIRPWVRFGSTTYQRNLLHAGPQYQALILCWRSGQRSPIHDHSGSACGVRVLQGVATETTFERSTQGLIFARASVELYEDQIIGSFDTDIHQVSNLQVAHRDLITLHIYSPALMVMNTYSLTDSKVEEFYDPVFAFSQGAGI